MVVRQTGAIQRPRRTPLATLPAIQALAREIGQRFQPRQIVLFGSYATGHATADSDVNLLVVMASPLSPLQQAAAIARHRPSVSARHHRLFPGRGASGAGG